MKKELGLIVGLLLIGCTQTQHDSQDRTISVIGTAKTKIVPDQVEIKIGVEFTNPALKTSVKQTREVIDQVFECCKKYVKDPMDIKTSSIACNKSYKWRNNENIFDGYSASQTLDVSLKDISKIEQFTEELLSYKISKIEDLRFDHSQSDSIMRSIDLVALEDAQATAEKMCKKMNISLGKIISITNYEADENQDRRQSSIRYRADLFTKGFGGIGFRINPEILEYANSVYVTFEIE